MAALRDVLVAVDASAHSAPAWAWAAQTLLPLLSPGGRCRLLCVAVPDDLDMALDDADAPWTIPSDSELRREAERRSLSAAQETLQRLVAAHSPPAGVDLTLLAAPLVGSVGETIEATLAQQPADLVVVGQRGMGSLKRCVSGTAAAGNLFLQSRHSFPALHACPLTRRSFLAGVADALALGHMGSVSTFCVCVPRARVSWRDATDARSSAATCDARWWSSSSPRDSGADAELVCGLSSRRER